MLAWKFFAMTSLGTWASQSVSCERSRISIWRIQIQTSASYEGLTKNVESSLNAPSGNTYTDTQLALANDICGYSELTRMNSAPSGLASVACRL